MKCRFISTYEELKRISPAWDALVTKSEYTSFFSTSGFTRAWWRAYENSRDMHVAVVEDNAGIPRLIAPFQAEKKNPHRWESVGTNLISYNPLIMQPGDHEGLRHLFGWLKHQSGWHRLVLRTTGEATLPRFFHLPYSASLSKMQKLYRWLRLRSFFVEQDVRRDHPYISQSGLKEMSNLLRKKSYRHSLNVLKREGVPRYQTIKDLAEIKRYFDRFCELHIVEWQSRGKTSQLANPETRNFYCYLFEEMVEYQTLRFEMLTLDDKPIAFLLTAKWKDRIDAWVPCFDLLYARGSPGRLLEAYMVPTLIAEGVFEFDLGRGLQPIKMEYTPDLRETVILSIHRSPIHAFATKLKARTVTQKAAL